TPGDAVSNVLRNAALHLGVPKLTGVVERGVEILSPVDLDDPVTTMGDGEFHLWFSYNEGAAGNTLHLLAFAGAAIVVFVHPRLRRGPARTWLLVAIAGFLAFSLPLVWQRWGSRLHTPVFLVASIPIAIVLGSVRRTLSACVLTLLFAGSLFYVFLNHQRPLLSILHPSIWAHPRDEQYLPEFPEWQAAYERAADFVRASHEPEIGLLFREIDYEYVLWVLAKDDFAGPPRIRHVGVERIRGQPRPAPPPAIVITSRMGERKVIGGFDYVPIHDFGRLRVLRRVGADEPRGTPVPRGSAVQ
ncbi:MAG TPA: hypothetical protein VFH69_05030, partial [Gemmatimonadota bacterium]|nr:hypothetical protein [Gemmatimonadota bacterium]